MNRISRSAVLTASAIMLLVPGVAYGASTAPTAPTAPTTNSSTSSPRALPVAPVEVSDEQAENENIGTVADKIYALGADQGLAGLQTDYVNNAITVYWSGQPPKNVEEFVASTPQGVAVKLVQSGQYSRAEAEAARSRIEASSLVTELKLYSISVDFRGSGLNVVSGLKEFTEDDIARLRSIAGIGGITVDAAKSEPRPFASRVNDAPPWKGGIRTVH